MKTFLKTCLFIPCLSLIMAFTLATKKTTVYIAGDSTASVKEPRYYPETGWGMPFAGFFDSTVVVDNRAKNGRSTRTFIEEKRWESIEQNLQEGDYVFIQFGHNDEVSTKKSFTNEKEFRLNLLRFIAETKAKKATPVLLTSVARRQFDSTGVLVDTHAAYSEITRSVAKETNVVFIDMDKQSQELIRKTGLEKSKFFFNHLAKDEHPNYPDGLEDNTHFNELGARRMAELVLMNVKLLNLDLARHIVKVPAKK